MSTKASEFFVIGIIIFILCGIVCGAVADVQRKEEYNACMAQQVRNQAVDLHCWRLLPQEPTRVIHHHNTSKH